MSCEVPVVISDSAENDKWIKNENNGFLFETQNHEQLAKILINLIKNQSLREKIGKEESNSLKKHFKDGGVLLAHGFNNYRKNYEKWGRIP